MKQEVSPKVLVAVIIVVLIVGFVAWKFTLGKPKVNATPEGAVPQIGQYGQHMQGGTPGGTPAGGAAPAGGGSSGGPAQ